MIEVVRQCDFDREKIKSVVIAAFESYWSSSREKVANDYGFSQAQVWLPDKTYPLLDTATKARVGGRLLPEVLLLAVPISKAAHAKKLKQAEKVLDTAGDLKAGKALRFDNLHARSAQASKAEAAKGFIDHCKRFESLVDPAKLQTLKAGNRAANPKFRQLQAHVYDLSKRTGKPYDEIVDAIYNDLPKNGGFYDSQLYAPRTEKHNLVAQLRLGEHYGLDSVENIARMRKGNAPIISKGEHAGQVAHVDHIIPLAKAPKLENSMANLRWLPANQNLDKGASMTPASLRRMKDLESEVGWKMDSP